MRWTGIVFSARKQLAFNEPGLLRELSLRGFIDNVSSPEHLHAFLQADSRTVYAGIDPSAPRVHLGHLVPILCLNHFAQAGHRILPIIGGATGTVGDPAGRVVSRNPEDLNKTGSHVSALQESVTKTFDLVRKYFQSKSGLPQTGFTSSSQFKVLNNHSWFSNFSLLDFLRVVGANSKVNVLLTRDSVRQRLESQHGLFFSEFAYQLLQAYDFYHLYTEEACTIQLGGADQWGNIVEGLSLISRLGEQSNGPEEDSKNPPQAFGLTTPLLVTPSGEKFGKSAGNAIWLDPDHTPVIEFYQYFMRLSDAEADKYISLFTYLPLDHCDELRRLHLENPSLRPLQKALAHEATEMIHGEPAARQVKLVSQILYEGLDWSHLDKSTIAQAFANTTKVYTPANGSEIFTTPLAKILANNKVLPSASAARQLILSKGLKVNGVPITQPNFMLSRDDAIEEKYFIIRAGPRNHFLLVLPS